MVWNKVVAGEFRDAGLLAVRLAVGAGFLGHGLVKLFKMHASGVAGMLSHTFFAPAAPFFAWILIIVEILGGLALILGLFPRIAGALLVVDMFFAIVLMRIHGPYVGGWELEASFLSVALLMLLNGPGRWSLEHLVKIKA